MPTNSMIPLGEALFYIGIEVVLLLLWAKFLGFLNREKPKKKKIKETILRKDNYPFDEGTYAGWFETYDKD